jgi:hypothetical protein
MVGSSSTGSSSRHYGTFSRQALALHVLFGFGGLKIFASSLEKVSYVAAVDQPWL